MADVRPLKNNIFDYDKEKKKYYNQVGSYLKTKKNSKYAPWTRAVVKKFIEIVKEGNSIEAAGLPLHPPKYRIMSKYEVLNTGNEDILITKRKKAYDPIIRIMPSEDCFDIIAEAHIVTEHGGHRKVVNFLKQKYIVPGFCIPIVLAHCNSCIREGKGDIARSKSEKMFNSRAQVFIISMEAQPDRQFHYILMYVDEYTKYLILRPLITAEEAEIAMEMLKIFLDFGPPLILETYDPTLMGKVLALIDKAAKFNITMYLPVELSEIGPNQIQTMMHDWIKENGSNSWAMACYLIQYKYNTTSCKNKYSPYDMVYRLPAKQSEDDVDNDETIEPSDYLEITCTSEDNLDTDITSDIMYADYYDSKDLIELDSDKEKCEEDISCSDFKFKEEDEITITQEPLRPEIIAPVIVSTSSLETIEQNKNELVGIKIEDDASTNNICPVCDVKISKAYYCINCKQNVHIFCSDQVFHIGSEAGVTCKTCVSSRNNPRLLMLKRKLEKMVEK